MVQQASCSETQPLAHGSSLTISTDQREMANLSSLSPVMDDEYDAPVRGSMRKSIRRDVDNGVDTRYTSGVPVRPQSNRGWSGVLAGDSSGASGYYMMGGMGFLISIILLWILIFSFNPEFARNSNGRYDDPDADPDAPDPLKVLFFAVVGGMVLTAVIVGAFSYYR